MDEPCTICHSYGKVNCHPCECNICPDCFSNRLIQTRICRKCIKYYNVRSYNLTYHNRNSYLGYCKICFRYSDVKHIICGCINYICPECLEYLIQINRYRCMTCFNYYNLINHPLDLTCHKCGCWAMVTFFNYVLLYIEYRNNDLTLAKTLFITGSSFIHHKYISHKSGNFYFLNAGLLMYSMNALMLMATKTFWKWYEHKKH